MKKRKIILKFVILSIILLVSMRIQFRSVLADTPGSVTIDTGVLTDDILYYEYVTVKFSVTQNLPWFYTNSWIYISGVKVDTTSEGVGTPFEGYYYPEAYVGNHTIRVVAHFINLQLKIEEVEDIAYFNVITCVDRIDLEDLRIDKLQDIEPGNKTWLDGSGITICIADDYLGAHEDLDGFHKSVYRSGKNDIYGNADRKYIDIDYYEYNSSTQTFEQNWDPATDTRLKKWEELFDENKDDYNYPHEIHGIYTLSVLRQITPAANFIFIETQSNYVQQCAAVDFILENNATLDIDIFCFSYSITTSSYESKFDSLEELGIISVNAAGNSGETYSNLQTANKPCSYDSVIGVTGVYDSNYSLSSDRWKLDDTTTSGYGLDIACISSKTMLDWAPVPSYDYFNGTSNSCPIISGIIALLKQYKNIYKSSSNFTTDEIQLIFEETGDESGTAPRLQSSNINGFYDSVNENGTYTEFPYYTGTVSFYETYAYGWGIIDAYEMYQYYKAYY